MGKLAVGVSSGEEGGVTEAGCLAHKNLVLQDSHVVGVSVAGSECIAALHQR